MLLGGLVMASWGGFRNRMRTMVASNLVMAACTIVLGLIPWFWPYLAIMASFGVAMPFYNAPSATMLQEHVEPEYIGRVFSVLTMLSTSLMPLGMLLFGPLADAIKIEWLLLVTGAAMLAQGLAALGDRKLMEAGEFIAAPTMGESATVPGAPGA
jgi:DHA3 family macrolide efflux protein-like MFS transporter